MFLFIYAASGPLHYSLHLHRAFCNNAGLMLQRQLELGSNISFGFNCKPDNKNRNPENL